MNVASETSSIAPLIAAMEAQGLCSSEDTRAIELARHTAVRLGLGPEAVSDVVETSLLHGLGKLWIPAKILDKRAPLTRREVRALHEHPTSGAAMLESIPELARLAPLVRASCERYDGKGYPEGLAGERIPLASRIVYACFAYVAMLSARPYRSSLGVESARGIVRDSAGRQFCPLVARTLLEVLALQDSPAGAATPERKRDEVSRPSLHVPSSSKIRERWARDRTPDRAVHIAYPCAGIVGLALGVWVALPIPSVDGRCPPEGEGRAQCIMQKVWLHELTVVFVAVCAVVLLTYLLVFKLPDVYRRWQGGDYDNASRPVPAPPDAALIAATWGKVPAASYGDVAGDATGQSMVHAVAVPMGPGQTG